LLEKIKAQYPADFEKSIFIGDTIKEIQAAKTIGCRAMLVKTGKGERTLQQHPELKGAVPIYANLKEAVSAILQEKTANE
jgi:D-glycero-D-manno-heptose 1,7-bisphosphate phosphatase